MKLGDSVSSKAESEALILASYNHFEMLETLANPYGLLGSATAWLLRAQHSSREQGRLQNHILFCHKHDYRDAEAIGHRT
jgi:hypothetical protein